MREERHTGRVGDRFILDADAVVYSKQRVGNADHEELQPGDVLVRTRHTGDCFCQYAVFRDGKRLPLGWCGYDGVGKYAGNVVADLCTIPGGSS